ncbi:MAG: RAMP superfamily CRISPR-associated protein [Desulfovibrio sp.]|jgi:CRISPR-associated protein Csm5|nr:RAMP superfamily CRISPR-associated protein [Desulfovibrio sp.]
MNAFLHSVRLCLTPLAPVHVGLGEEFDPTGYVIEDNLLYAFDPSRAVLPDGVREKLLDAASSGKLDGIQKIYRLLQEHKELFTPHAHSIIPVADGVAKKYSESLGKPVQTEGDLKNVFNNNYLERAAYLPGNGNLYLPGSSVKGAIRTAWLEALYAEAPSEIRARYDTADDSTDNAPPSAVQDKSGTKLEETLLLGRFHTSPLRLLKTADFMPQGDIARKIVFACNFKKYPPKSTAGNRERAVATRKEVILPGQYRAFVSETVIQDLSGMGNMPGKLPFLRPDIKKFAGYCNTCYRKRFDEEFALLSRRNFADKGGLERLDALYRQLHDKLEAGEAFLIRLGRFSTAESKTIAAAARIRIMTGKGNPPRFRRTGTTVWLAADDEHQQSGLLPFGWALVEINPEEDCRPLLDWCNEESRGHPDMRAAKDALENKRRDAEKAARAKKVEEDAVRLQAEAEAQARADEARRKAAMSGEERKLEHFCATIEQHRPLKAGEAGAAVLNDCAAFLDAALTWPDKERKLCADSIAPLLKAKNMYQGKKGALFKDYLNRLRS